MVPTYSEILFANNFAKKCFFAPKIIPKLMFELLYKLVSFFILFGKGIDISKLLNTWLQTKNY